MAMDDYGPALLASMWAMFFITSVVVGLRVFARVKAARLGYDDWIIVVCWLVFLATAVVASLVVSWGFGKHIYDIPPADRPRARRGQVMGTSVVILSFASPKFGITATVQRATSPPTTFWRRMFAANWLLCTASFLFLLSVSVFQFAQCRPVAYQWGERVPGTGSCIGSEVNIRLAYASSAFSTALDLYFSLLPAAIIWKLQMSQRSRLLMIMVLGGAGSATVASVVKMWKLGDAIAQIADDPTYAMSDVYILVYAETTLLIVGASIAAVFPLFRNAKTWILGTPGDGGNESRSGTPLRTFGQGTFKKRRGFFEDDNDETTLTRGDVTGDFANTSVDGIVRTTDVEQTWGAADAESQSITRSRQLGLASGIV